MVTFVVNESIGNMKSREDESVIQRFMPLIAAATCIIPSIDLGREE